MPRRLRQITRGYFDIVKNEGEALRVVGWMFRLDGPFEQFELRLNGRAVERQPAIELDRVGKAYASVPHAGQSGFSFLHPSAGSSGTVEVVGLRNGRAEGSIRSVLPKDPEALGALPPTPLMLRVTGSDNPDFFRADGGRTFADFASAVERHGGFGGIRRMLDWGCGCGRVTAYFLADGRVAEVHGVDIDGEATAWCAQALPRGRFQQTGLYPPLPFPDGFFDLVIAYSVFTHLERGVQKSWLDEMKRILSPGGLLLATVHGEFAALFTFPDRAPRTLRERLSEWLGRRPAIEGEINDSTVDHAIDRLAPGGYYRSVFQTRRYTRREWSPILDVLEYREAGVGNFQDLVVLRRRAG